MLNYPALWSAGESPQPGSHRCLPYRNGACHGDTCRGTVGICTVGKREVEVKDDNWLGGDAVQKERIWEE